MTDLKVSTKVYLQDRWRRTLDKLQVKPSLGLRFFGEIFRQYSAESRHYHNINHLRFGFETLDEVFQEEPSLGLVEAAFWYHDFVYVPKLLDNESKSAFLAADRLQRGLGVPEDATSQVAILINATAHNAPPRTRDAEILLDIDLAILGAEPEDFDAYERGIWLEYQGFVESDDFCHGRLKVLRGFQRKHLFWSPEMRQSAFEQRAKVNLRRAIQKLAQGVTP